MASLKTAMNSHQKTHKERGQLSSRKHMGLLEKRKDYLQRAKDFHRKEATIKKLKQKASEKNPDEFYFQMIHKRTNDGVHVKEHMNKVYTKDQIKLLKTQDLNYVNLKKNTEAKKIEKLQASLHLTDFADKQKRKHIFFVDTKEEEECFDVAKQFNTVPELLCRKHNIPTLEALHQVDFNWKASSQQFNLDKEKTKAYKEFQSRIERDELLSQTRQEMVLKRHLSGKGTVRKRKSGDGKACYRWKKSRKR